VAFTNPFALTDQRILITGATSGIGYSTALVCAQMGAEVIGIGRDEVRLQRTQEALQGISGKPHRMIKVDLTVAADRESLAASISAPINGLLHSAGISRLCPVRMMTEQHLRELQSINVEAPMLLTQALLKRNLIAADGSIVFLASIAAHIGVPGVAAYSGTKAALIAMMRCLALEVIKRGIRTNCLSPALVETPLLDTAMSYLEAERKHYPLGFGRPDDVANAAVFLLSNASRWITGTTIVMDGGLTIS
jgi:NAD(P)-dependent dehydrogenase (short-subunit alcohol dehydrogenase family)